MKVIYRTYSNSGEKAVSEIITSYLLSKLPVKVTKSKLISQDIAKLTKMTDKIKQIYIGNGFGNQNVVDM